MMRLPIFAHTKASSNRGATKNGNHAYAVLSKRKILRRPPTNSPIEDRESTESVESERVSSSKIIVLLCDYIAFCSQMKRKREGRTVVFALEIFVALSLSIYPSRAHIPHHTSIFAPIPPTVTALHSTSPLCGADIRVLRRQSQR
jgi:hypothetical protein